MWVIQRFLKNLWKKDSEHKSSRSLIIEKRQEKRYPDGQTTYFFTALGRCLETKIIDISSKGVRIAVEDNFPNDLRGELLLSFNGTTLNLPLQFAWKKKSYETFEYGAQFISLTPSYKSLIKRYINYILQKDMELAKANIY